MYLHDGVDHQQGSITLVALHIQVVQILYIGKAVVNILLLVALPSIESEILGIECETAETTEVELGLRLDAEAASHVIVAFNHVEIVTLGAAEQDAAEEYTLLRKMNVRKAPNLKADKVKVLDTGTEVLVSEITNDWLHLADNTFILYEGGKNARKDNG